MHYFALCTAQHRRKKLAWAASRKKSFSNKKKRPWRVCQKSSGACRNAKSLFERSEFDLADTETTNFWQRSRHSLDFSLILDFAHVQQIENKFSFVFTQSQNWFVSLRSCKEMNEAKTQRLSAKVERAFTHKFHTQNKLLC